MAIIDVDTNGKGPQDIVKFLPVLIILGLVLLGLSTMFYQVQIEEVAVVTRFGEHVRNEEPGLHFKLPFGIENAQTVATARLHKMEFGFATESTRSGSRTRYAQRDYPEVSLILTGDLAVADVEWIVQYRINDAFNYLFRVRDPEGTLRDVSEAIMRLAVGDRSIDEVLTIGRADIQDAVKTRLNDKMKEYGTGIKVQTVKLQNVTPPKEVKASFNEVNKAKQDNARVINEAKQRYNEKIPKARGEKEKKIRESQGYAKERVNRAEGEANRFDEILKEYRKAPEVTRKRMYLETMTQVLGSVKDKYVVDEDVKSILPMMNIGKEATK